MKNKIQLFTQKALFAKGDEVLILNSARDEYWELPGGKLEVGEEPETGLRREVKEELDIDDFEVQKILHVFSFEATDEDADWYFVVCVYLCKLGDENIRLSEEHSVAKWVKISQIRSYLMRSGYWDAAEKLLDKQALADTFKKIINNVCGGCMITQIKRFLSYLLATALVFNISFFANYNLVEHALAANDQHINTIAASPVDQVSATLNGTNGDAPAEVSGEAFWYGPTTDNVPFTSGTNVVSQIPAGWTPVYATTVDLAADGSFSVPIATLTPNNDYFFAAWVQVGSTWYPGDILSFVTSPVGQVYIDTDADNALDPGELTFATIQAAIDDSTSAGKTIIVGANTYGEDLTVSKSLTIKGEGDATLINGNINATGDNVTIQNLKITNLNPHDGGVSDFGVKTTAGKTLTLEAVTIDVLHNGVYMTGDSLTNDTALTINNSTVKGYGAVYLNGAINSGGARSAIVTIHDTSLIGSTSYSGTFDDFSTLGLDYAQHVNIVFTGASSVANEYTSGAQAKERLITFWDANDNTVTGSPTYTNGHSEINDGALFLSGGYVSGYSNTNTIVGQTVGRYAYDTATFEAAIASGAAIPIVVGRAETAIVTAPGTQTLNAGARLIIEAPDSTLVTISSGTTLVNNGTITIESGAALINNGTIAITVTANAQSKERGAADPALTYTGASSLVTGDTFTGSLTRTAGEAIGAYSITQGTLLAGAHYAITYIGANLTISDTIAPTISSYTVSETKISPNNDATNESSSIDVAYSEQVDADINILDNLGVEVRSLYSASDVTDPTAKVWNGKNDSNVVVADGVYTIQVIGTDSAGLTVTDTSRTIAVDNTAPVITLNGITPDIEIGGIYTELGATAVDAVDGSSAATPSGSVNTALFGSYTITYNATDSVGNHATSKTRTVNVVDTTPPDISSTWLTPNPATTGDEVVIKATVTDNRGIASVRISINGGTYNLMDDIGDYQFGYPVPLSSLNTINYTVKATDVTGLITTKSGTIDPSDNDAPTIAAITGDTSGTTGESVPISVTATDNIGFGHATITFSGGTHDMITSGSSFSYNIPIPTGSAASIGYFVTVYDATSNLTSSQIYNIVVTDNDAPVITLTGNAVVTLEVSSSYTEQGATWTDNVDGSGAATASGTVNADVVGDYTVYYNYSDAQGNPAVQVTRTVHIVDTTKPVVALNGTNPVTIEVHGTYSESGAIVTDNYDTGLIAIITGTVDINTVGSYILYYDAIDSSSNNAVQVTRTVNVVDTTAPTKPVSSPGAGDYINAQSVQLSSTDNYSSSANISIYYTTDGSDPAVVRTENIANLLSLDGTTTKYSAPISITTDTTIKAIAYDEAGNASEILIASYNIAPVISVEASSNPSETSITITWTTNEVATSRVIYDTASHSSISGYDEGSNYGYAFSTAEDANEDTSHSVTITGLTAGTTYYYRSVSHGSPESVGAEKSFTTQQAQMVSTSPSSISQIAAARRFVLASTDTNASSAEVSPTATASVSATAAPTETVTPEVKGTTTETEKTKWWIWAILGIAVLLAGYGIYMFYARGDDEEEKYSKKNKK